MKSKLPGEFNLIDRIHRMNKVRSKDVILGIGDDAAAIRSGKGTLLLTTDTLVENVHFSRKYCSFSDIGWKLMAANISDIAAMAGRPKFALVTLGLNNTVSTKDVDELYKGMKALGSKYKISIVGGDIVKSPKALFFTMDMIGNAKRIVKRSGARPGDIIMVSGPCGSSSAGLRELKKHGKKAAQKAKAHLRPVPKVKEALMLSEIATSMIDNSDGLARSILEITSKSGTGARVYANSIPLAKGATLKDALDGGEDYNLVYTVPYQKVLQANGRMIGEIIKRGPVILVDQRGIPGKMTNKGFEHI